LIVILLTLKKEGEILMTQKTKSSVILSMAIAVAVCFASGALLAPSDAQAATVLYEHTDPDVATGISSLDIAGTFYNVAFHYLVDPEDIYGPFTGTYTFTTAPAALNALKKVNDALNFLTPPSKAEQVGSKGGVNASAEYYVGYEGFEFDPGPGLQPFVKTFWGFYDVDDWVDQGQVDNGWENDPATYASFEVVPIPAAVWLLGGGLIGLLGLRRKFKN